MSFGGLPPGKMSIDHPPPTTHGSSGFADAYSETIRSYSRASYASERLQRSISKPLDGGWTCASWNPGTSSLPARSTTSVPEPISSPTSPSVPTATI